MARHSTQGPEGETTIEEAKTVLRAVGLRQLIELREFLDELVSEKQQHEIERLREEVRDLGIDPAAVFGPVPAMQRRSRSGGGGRAKHWYRHPSEPQLVWKGKGLKPKWLRDLQDDGHDLAELRIEPEA